MPPPVALARAGLPPIGARAARCAPMGEAHPVLALVSAAIPKRLDA